MLRKITTTLDVEDRIVLKRILKNRVIECGLVSAGCENDFLAGCFKHGN